MNSVAVQLRDRAALAGLSLSQDLSEALLTYLGLLARWNRRINLTAFDAAAPSDAAIDRLLVEPIAAASLVRAGDRRGLDIGSGGGSPAVPLMLAAPSLEMVLVEVRSRKAAFLREVIRTMSLAARVEVGRVEDVAAESREVFDLVTFRAVRADVGVWGSVERLLAPSGRVLWFGGIGQSTNMVEVGVIGSTVALQRSSPMNEV